MKKLSILGLLAGTTLLCAFPVSLQLSQDKLSVSLDTASARVGRPLTPVSVAGVARRTDRRAYRRGAVAAGAAIGAGAYYGTGPNYGAGSYYGSGADGVVRRPYYASGGNYSGYDAYASTNPMPSGRSAMPNYGDHDTYVSRGVPISEAKAVGYGTGPYYGAGSYYGNGVVGVARRPYYASGGNYSGYDAYASANYGDHHTYTLRLSEAEAVRYCAQTFRSYDIGSRTFLASSGQRVSCPQ